MRGGRFWAARGSKDGDRAERVLRLDHMVKAFLASSRTPCRDVQTKERRKVGDRKDGVVWGTESRLPLPAYRHEDA